VYPLFKDHSGNLWVGTEGFVDRFDPKSETFTHYRLNQLPANSLSKAVIHISEDSSGTLWLSTRNGLFSLDSNRRGMKRYFHDPTDPFSLGDSQIISSGEDRAGNFWVGTRISLDEFDRETGKVTHHIQGGDSGVGRDKTPDALRVRLENRTSAGKSGVFHARRQRRNHVVWYRCRGRDEVRSLESLLCQLPSRPRGRRDDWRQSGNCLVRRP
jgi:ligand-binding sensor domain-containing protein